MPVPVIKPIRRIILQADDNTTFYSANWDETFEINIDKDTGTGTLSHNGNIYKLTSSNTIISN